MAIFLVGSGKLPIGDVVSKEVLSMPPLHRWAWNYASLFFVRMKYYFAWKVAEGSCVLAGFGFQGYNDKGEVAGWDGVSNMDVKGFELAGNTTEAARAWNKGASFIWAKREGVAEGTRLMCSVSVGVMCGGQQARRSGCSATCTSAAATT